MVNLSVDVPLEVGKMENGDNVYIDLHIENDSVKGTTVKITDISAVDNRYHDYPVRLKFEKVETQ